MDNRHSPPRFVPATRSALPLSLSLSLFCFIYLSMSIFFSLSLRIFPYRLLANFAASSLRSRYSPFNHPLPSASNPCVGFSIGEGSRANRSDDLANEIISPEEKFEPANLSPRGIQFRCFRIPLTDPSSISRESQAKRERIARTSVFWIFCG